MNITIHICISSTGFYREMFQMKSNFFPTFNLLRFCILDRLCVTITAAIAILETEYPRYKSLDLRMHINYEWLVIHVVLSWWPNVFFRDFSSVHESVLSCFMKGLFLNQVKSYNCFPLRSFMFCSKETVHFDKLYYRTKFIMKYIEFRHPCRIFTVYIYIYTYIEYKQYE